MKIFIAHASADRDKVDLLDRLLRFHGFEITSAHSGFSAAPLDGTVIVVISEEAAACESFKADLTALVRGSGADIVCLRLDRTTPAQLCAELARERTYDFGMRGLDDLFGLLGSAFLNFDQLPDRRKSDIGMRLRKGMWLTFYRVREMEKFEPLIAHGPVFSELESVLIEEARRYRYSSRADRLSASPETALHSAVEGVRPRLTGQRMGAVFIIEEIAAELVRQYDIESVDRRKVSSSTPC